MQQALHSNDPRGCVPTDSGQEDLRDGNDCLMAMRQKQRPSTEPTSANFEGEFYSSIWLDTLYRA
ncbi:hypothetical protein V5799_020276, partial [Amblyomma americanum]